jgi:hypothetical protein
MNKVALSLVFAAVCLPKLALAQGAGVPPLPPAEPVPGEPAPAEAPPGMDATPVEIEPALPREPRRGPPSSPPLRLDGSYGGRVTYEMSAPPSPEEATERDAEGDPRPTFDPWKLSAGLRVGYIRTRGFDSFADDNALPQFSLEGTYAFLRSDRIALAVGLGWDVGGRTGALRQLDTNLGVHRFSVPIEGRLAVLPWLWATGKVSPGASLMLASVQDPSAPADLEGSAWALSADASVGAAFVLGPKTAASRAPRFVFGPEIGYAIATRPTLRVQPDRDEDDVLGADGSTTLTRLALSGVFWRLSAGATF